MMLSCLLIVNGQQIPDVPPPEVGANYEETKCNSDTINRIFCNEAANSNTCSIRRGLCIANRLATPIETCANYCDDVALAANVAAGRAWCTNIQPSRFSSRFPPEATRVPCTPPTAQTDLPFVCVQLGIFPNPTSCERYFRCDISWNEDGTTRLTATSVNCPANFVFDPSIRGPVPCISRRIDDTCITSSCTGDSTEVLRYPRMSAALGEIGVRCVGRVKLVYRCGPNSQLRFGSSEDPPTCSYVCQFENQQFANVNSPGRYFVCRRNSQNNALTSISVDCGASQFYDPVRNVCVF